jgi:hypothetical protein
VLALSEMEARNDPMPNVTRPATSTFLRPTRSPRLPAASRRPAKTSR